MKMNNLPKIRLYCEDCVTGIPLRVGNGYVDLIVTSPPYNLGVKYNTYQDTRKWVDYLEWTVRWASVVKDALKDDEYLRIAMEEIRLITRRSLTNSPI